MPVYIVRHGQTKLNEGNKIRGWIDVPLDGDGKLAAHKLGDQLRDKLHHLFASDLQRASGTARIISQITGAPLIGILHCLRPWNMGRLNGADSARVGPILRQLIANPDAPAPDGETFNNFKQRFLNCILHLDSQSQGQSYAIVTHHRGERLLDAWQKAGRKPDLSIDPKEMEKKGIEPGTFREVQGI